MLDEIRAKHSEIYAIVRRHKADRLWVFGSCARKEERPDSDVDFLVRYTDRIGPFEHSDFEREISEAVGRHVDFVSDSAHDRSPFFAYNPRKNMVAL